MWRKPLESCIVLYFYRVSSSILFPEFVSVRYYRFSNVFVTMFSSWIECTPFGEGGEARVCGILHADLEPEWATMPRDRFALKRRHAKTAAFHPHEFHTTLRDWAASRSEDETQPKG